MAVCVSALHPFDPVATKEPTIAYPIPTQRIKPRRLRPGATIGIVAPASPFESDVFDQGVAIVQAMGFETRLAQGISARQGYLAGDDAFRAAQLMAMWADERVDAVICARGGYGSLRILPLLNFQQMVARPMPFIGFSDICTLHQQFLFQVGLVTFHGPTVCSLVEADEQTRGAFFEALTGEVPLQIVAESPRVIAPGRSQGILTGGNLTTLCHLVGTAYAPSYEKCVLFIEDRGEEPYRIDRMLVQMKMAGCFRGLAGLILGTFKDCGSMDDIIHIIGDVFGDLDVPVLAGFAAGHTHRNLILPFGVEVRLDADRGELTLLESPTSD